MSRLSLYILVLVLMVTAPLVAVAEKQSPKTVPGATAIDAAKAKALFDQGVIFVDTRNDADWEAGRIPDAVHLGVYEVLSEETLSEVVKKDESVVFYCNGFK